MEPQPSSFWCIFLTDSRQMCGWRRHWLLDWMPFLALFFSALSYFPFSFFGKFFAGDFICAHGFTTYPLVDEFLFQLWTFSHGPDLNVQHHTKHFLPRVAQRAQTQQTPNQPSAPLSCLVTGATTVLLYTQPSQSQPWLWLFWAPDSIRHPLSVDVYWTQHFPGSHTLLRWSLSWDDCPGCGIWLETRGSWVSFKYCTLSPTPIPTNLFPGKHPLCQEDGAEKWNKRLRHFHKGKGSMNLQRADRAAQVWRAMSLSQVAHQPHAISDLLSGIWACTTLSHLSSSRLNVPPSWNCNLFIFAVTFWFSRPPDYCFLSLSHGI